MRSEGNASNASALNHPNICALYDVGNQDGMEFLVLEYVLGETVAQQLVKGPLPTKLLLRYGIEIPDALEKAHHNGVIHRDLKPSSII
jgi:serine/threonine protein kinase